MHISAKDTAASAFSGDRGRSTSVQRCWGCFTSLWWQVTIFFSFAAACRGRWVEGRWMPTDSVSWSGRPVMVWRRSRTVVKRRSMAEITLHHGQCLLSPPPPLRNDLAKTRSSFSKRLIMPKCTSEVVPDCNIKLFNASLRQWKLYVTYPDVQYSLFFALLLSLF